MVEGLARTARDGAAGSPAHEYGHEMGLAACAAATADDEPLEPAPGAGGLDEEVQASAVGGAVLAPSRPCRDGGLGAWFGRVSEKSWLQHPCIH